MTLTGRIKTVVPKISLNYKDKRTRNIVIVFPMDEPSFRVAIYTFRKLGKNDTYKRNFKFIIRNCK